MYKTHDQFLFPKQQDMSRNRSVLANRCKPVVLHRMTVALLLVCVNLAEARAQDYGAIGGVVVDSGGTRMAGDVPIVVEDPTTGHEWVATSSVLGYYEISSLPPGHYIVRVDLRPLSPFGFVGTVAIKERKVTTCVIHLKVVNDEQLIGAGEHLSSTETSELVETGAFSPGQVEPTIARATSDLTISLTLTKQSPTTGQLKIATPVPQGATRRAVRNGSRPEDDCTIVSTIRVRNRPARYTSNQYLPASESHTERGIATVSTTCVSENSINRACVIAACPPG
jgi:hypothetical protein